MDNLPAAARLLGDGAEQLGVSATHLPAGLCRVVSPSAGGKGVRENRKRWREVHCRVGTLKRGPVELDGASSRQGLSWRERRAGPSYAWGWGAAPVPTPQTPPALLGGKPSADSALCPQLSEGNLQPSRGMPRPPTLQPPTQMCQGRYPPEPGLETPPFLVPAFALEDTCAWSMEETGLTWLGRC